MSTPLERPLIGAEDAARLTGTSVPLIRKLIAQREIPVVKIGRLVRIRPEDLEAYTDRNTRRAR